MKKIIVKYKIAKRKFLRNFYQKMADFIIEKLKKTDNHKDFMLWYHIGLQLDTISSIKNIRLK